jgi:hypothetical protein
LTEDRILYLNNILGKNENILQLLQEQGTWLLAEAANMKSDLQRNKLENAS